LIFITEETKILFYFIVLSFDFTIIFRMVSSSEASFNTKIFVESMHELGYKLQTVMETRLNTNTREQSRNLTMRCWTA
jgi:hypothetical protein